MRTAGERSKPRCCNFPPDTYAGADVLVPIADRFRRGDTDLDIHVFDCALGPRILTLHADLARAPWSFRPHDGELARADAHPVFGWFNHIPEAVRTDYPDVVRSSAGLRLRRRDAVALLPRPGGFAGKHRPAVKPQPAFERPKPPALQRRTETDSPHARAAVTGAAPSAAPPLSAAAQIQRRKRHSKQYRSGRNSGSSQAAARTGARASVVRNELKGPWRPRVTRAFAAVVPNARALRLFVLKGRLAMCADALRFGAAGTAR